MKCPNCGASIYHDINRCQYCGAYQQQSNQSVQYIQPQQQQQPVIVNIINQNNHNTRSTNLSSKSKLVAFLLCLFGGYFGLHKFYLGKVTVGIFYLFTMGFFCFGWFFDLIVIALGGATDKFGRKLS